MSDLSVNLKLIDGKSKLRASARNNNDLVLDYFPPIGNGEGYTSQELLLISFASCLGTTLVSLLRYKMQKEVSDLKISASGDVRGTHPKALSKIEVKYTITSKDIEDLDVLSAIKSAKESICPLWALLRGNVDISVEYVIKR